MTTMTDEEPSSKTSLWKRICDHIPLTVKDWTVSIFIGFLTVSHWRSLWVLFDIWLCDQPADATLAAGTNFCFAVPATEDEAIQDKRFDSAVFTYFLGVGLLIVSVVLMWGGIWYPDNDTVTPARGVIRFLLMYMLGVACNCIWRGIWYFTDYWVFPNDPNTSYYVTSFVGAAGAFAILAGGSLLAPPAIFLLDGPAIEPPPVAVTMLSTYYDLTLPADSNEPPKLPLVVYVFDILITFFGLPILVVWFWRGTWYLMDDWFWGFTDSDSDVAWSILWTSIFSVICTVVTSEDIMKWFESLWLHEKIGTAVVGRLRTFIMAWGTVAFWRAVWTFWDLYLGKSSKGSAYGGEVASIVLLTFLGCLACITAPPSTIGVDFVPNPESADEPLFAMLPLPWDLLYLGAIGRNPCPAEEPTTGEAEKKGEVELPRMGEREEEPVPPSEELEEEEVRHASSKPLRLRSAGRLVASLNAGVTEVRFGGSISYCEMQRPHLLKREKSIRCIKQRPGLENARNRSQYFRNR